MVMAYLEGVSLLAVLVLLADAARIEYCEVHSTHDLTAAVSNKSCTRIGIHHGRYIFDASDPAGDAALLITRNLSLEAIGGVAVLDANASQRDQRGVIHIGSRAHLNGLHITGGYLSSDNAGG